MMHPTIYAVLHQTIFLFNIHVFMFSKSCIVAVGTQLVQALHSIISTARVRKVKNPASTFAWGVDWD